MHAVHADSFQSIENKVVLLMDCLEGKRIELGQSSHIAWFEHLNSILTDVQNLRLQLNN